MGQLFFMRKNHILIFFYVQTDTDAHIDNPKPICFPFFPSWGITTRDNNTEINTDLHAYVVDTCIMTSNVAIAFCYNFRNFDRGLMRKIEADHVTQSFKILFLPYCQYF